MASLMLLPVWEVTKMKAKLRLAGALIGFAMLATPISAAAKNNDHYFGNNRNVARNFGPHAVNRHDYRNGHKATWVPAPRGLYPLHDADDDDRGWRRDWEEDHHCEEDRELENEDNDWEDDDDYSRYYPAPVYGSPLYAAPAYGYGDRNCWRAQRIVNTYWRDRNMGHPAAASDLLRQNEWAFRSGCRVGPAPYNYGYSGGHGYAPSYGGSSNLTPLLQQLFR